MNSLQVEIYEVVEMLVAALDWMDEYPDDFAAELSFLSLRKRLVMLLHERCD